MPTSVQADQILHLNMDLNKVDKMILRGCFKTILVLFTPEAPVSWVVFLLKSRTVEFRAVLKACSPPPLPPGRPFRRRQTTAPPCREERVRPLAPSLLPVWPRATPGASLSSLVLRVSCKGAAPSPGPRQGGHQTVGACPRVPPPCNGAVCSFILGSFLWF